MVIGMMPVVAAENTTPATPVTSVSATDATGFVNVNKSVNAEHGNSIYFSGNKKSSRTIGFIAALNIIFFLLQRPVFA